MKRPSSSVLQTYSARVTHQITCTHVSDLRLSLDLSPQRVSCPTSHLSANAIGPGRLGEKSRSAEEYLIRGESPQWGESPSMKLSQFIIASLVVLRLAIVTTPDLPINGLSPAPLRTFRLTIDGRQFTLGEIDVGTRSVATRATSWGLCSRTAAERLDGPSMWMIQLHISPAGQTAPVGISAARVVGGPRQLATAVWVIQELFCGASCAGLPRSRIPIHAFAREDLPHDQSDGYSDTVVVSEVITQTMGLGGAKFPFPLLVLYVNNGYHECPSLWTRTTYIWTEVSNVDAKFILTHEVSHESQQCYFSIHAGHPIPATEEEARRQ